MIEGNEESMEMKRWKDFDRVRVGPQSCLSVAPIFYLSTFLYDVDFEHASMHLYIPRWISIKPHAIVQDLCPWNLYLVHKAYATMCKVVRGLTIAEVREINPIGYISTHLFSTLRSSTVINRFLRMYELI